MPARLAAAISRFGTRLRFALAGEVGVNSARSTSIVPAAAWPKTGMSVWVRIVLTWSGVRFGRACRSRATAPATTGAAIDVPPALKSAPPMAQFGHSVRKALLGASTETMCAPGAITSGLANPSCVWPVLDQAARSPRP